jgi:hypothetical protein
MDGTSALRLDHTEETPNRCSKKETATVNSTWKPDLEEIPQLIKTLEAVKNRSVAELKHEF